MTIQEFEKTVDRIKHKERNIKYLKECLEKLKSLEDENIRIDAYLHEDESYEFGYFFNKEILIEIHEKQLNQVIQEYKDEIEKLKQCGLLIEPNLEIIEGD